MKQKITSLPQFYISIIKDTVEYKEVLERVERLSTLMAETSKEALTSEQLDFINSNPRYVQPLDRVFVLPSVVSGKTVGNLESRRRLDGLYGSILSQYPLYSNSPNGGYPLIPTILYIDELFLDGDIYSKFKRLYDLGKSKPLDRILRRIFEKDSSMMRVLWPFPDFPRFLVNGGGIGPENSYKFFKDVNDLKCKYYSLYMEIVGTYKSNIPQIIKLLIKILNASDIIEKSNYKQKLFIKYYAKR